MRSDQEIMTVFKAAVKEVENKELPAIDLTTELSQLGLDSVTTMEVIGAMEERLNLRFPDEDLATLKRVGDLTALVQRLG